LDWGRDFIVKTTYPVVLAAWCASAWRRDVEKILSPATMRRLQPWRAQ
jgi:hypothetical protein